MELGKYVRCLLCRLVCEVMLNICPQMCAYACVWTDNVQIREATEEEARIPLQEWQAAMARKRAERLAKEAASKKSGDGGRGGSGGGGGADGKGDGNGSGRSHGSGRRSKHSGRMSSRRKKYRRNEFQQMQQEVRGYPTDFLKSEFSIVM